MNCLPFEEKIAQYVDGGLDRDDARHIEEHLRGCPGCAEFADRLEYDRIGLQTAPPEIGDVDFAGVRRQIRTGIIQERRKILVPALLVAASILISVGIAAFWFVPGGVRHAPHTAQVKAPEPIETRQAEPPAPPMPARVVKEARARKLGLVGQAVSPVLYHPAHPASTPVPKADPALEAALQGFLAAEQPPPVPPEPTSAIEIRIVTGDPHVILILLQETSGVSNE
jgi:hypothetical protein